MIRCDVRSAITSFHMSVRENRDAAASADLSDCNDVGALLETTCTISLNRPSASPLNTHAHAYATHLTLLSMSESTSRPKMSVTAALQLMMTPCESAVMDARL